MDHSRRAVLSMCGTAAVTGLAGCSGLGGGDPPERLVAVGLQNADTEPHTLELAVTREDTVVYWERERLAPETVRLQAADWEETGSFTLIARVDGGPARVERFPDAVADVDGECFQARAEFTEAGELGIDMLVPGCPDGSPSSGDG